MNPEQIGTIGIAAKLLLGIASQWFLFGPKKVSTLGAVGGIMGAGALLWWWSTPDSLMQFHDNWRLAIYSLGSFIASAKGFGSLLAMTPLAPKSDTL